MKKLLLLLAILWFGLNAFAKSVQASEYNKAVIGNVITNAGEVDVSKIMEQELQKLAHQFALESITIIQQYLPVVLDGVITQMKLEADKEYKCSLLKDTKIKDDC